MIAADGLHGMQVLIKALPPLSTPSPGCTLALIAVDDLPCMQVLTTASRPQVLDTRILTAFFEEIASRLHALTASDTAHCLWAFCTLGLAQVMTFDDL